MLWEADYEELLTTDIMIGKPSIMLTTRKSFFFSSYGEYGCPAGCVQKNVCNKAIRSISIC